MLWVITFSTREFGVTLEGHLDIFLGAHVNYFGLQEKCRLMKDGANPLVDPEGYKHHIAQKEPDFYTELAKQKQKAAAA